MNISQVYNYLNHDLVPKRRTRTHKASELKAVYNSISKYNQSSPLYLVSLSESRQEHMIDIKEHVPHDHDREPLIHDYAHRVRLATHFPHNRQTGKRTSHLPNIFSSLCKKS